MEAKDITGAVSRLFQDACHHLPGDVLAAIKRALEAEESAAGREVLSRLIQNVEIAASDRVPLCQDTGDAILFLEMGQDAHVTGGDLYAAINDGVRQAYAEGYLRKSMVARPFSARVNTKDNTPAIIYTDIVPGDRLRIIAVPKGGGAENMSRLAMLKPAEGRAGVIDFVLRTVDEAGANPCPPVIVGVGIGGTAEKSALMAKHALTREVGKPSPDAEVAELERELLARINNLGIGPMGYGGRVTALAVHIEVFPAHIASLPVAVNLQCWCGRHQETIL